jgi:hypothetical protein
LPIADKFADELRRHGEDVEDPSPPEVVVSIACS